MDHGEKPHPDDRRGPVWPRAGWAQAALVPNIISLKSLRSDPGAYVQRYVYAGCTCIAQKKRQHMSLHF